MSFCVFPCMTDGHNHISVVLHRCLMFNVTGLGFILKQRDENPADKTTKHQVPLRPWVMADASTHMTAASSADADGAEKPNVTFSECHITSGLDVTR